MTEQKTFRQIIKGTAIFGGSQAITMLISIVRGKLVAIILGSFGMGIAAMLQSALNPFLNFFMFGLPTSAVRDISQESEAISKRYETIVSLRRMLLVLSTAGAILMALSSTILSKTTFGTEDHWPWFVEMAIALFFFILVEGEKAILQGFRKLKKLALAGLVIPLLGLFAGIPLYYLYGVDGIAPAMVVVSFVSWIVTRWFTSKTYSKLPSQKWGHTWNTGKNMLSLGGIMMVSALIGSLSIYALNTFIGRHSEDDVGFYQAAYIITIQCTTMIFSAMGTDYFPHLSSIAHDNKQLRKLVENEGETVLLIMTPIILLIILFAPVIIQVLYIKKFLVMTPLLQMIAASFISRAFCFPQDYVCIAKGDKKYFFYVEGIFTNAKTLIVLCGSYYLWGLNGLGYGYLMCIVLDILQSSILNYWRYKVYYGMTYIKLFVPCLALILVDVAASLIQDAYVRYSVMAASTSVGCFMCIYQLDRRIDVRETINRRLRRKRA